MRGSLCTARDAHPLDNCIRRLAWQWRTSLLYESIFERAKERLSWTGNHTRECASGHTYQHQSHTICPRNSPDEITCSISLQFNFAKQLCAMKQTINYQTLPQVVRTNRTKTATRNRSYKSYSISRSPSSRPHVPRNHTTKIKKRKEKKKVVQEFTLTSTPAHKLNKHMTLQRATPNATNRTNQQFPKVSRLRLTNHKINGHIHIPQFYQVAKLAIDHETRH